MKIIYFVLLILIVPYISAQATDGDKWHVDIRNLYTNSSNSAILLTTSWDIWSPWAIPYKGYEDRVTNLTVTEGVDVIHENVSIYFYLLTPIQPDDVLPFNLTIHADGVSTNFIWYWQIYDACQVNKIVGGTADKNTTLNNEKLIPILSPINSNINGIGLAKKTGHGPTGYECRSGNIP